MPYSTCVRLSGSLAYPDIFLWKRDVCGYARSDCIAKSCSHHLSCAFLLLDILEFPCGDFVTTDDWESFAGKACPEDVHLPIETGQSLTCLRPVSVLSIAHLLV